APGVRRAENRAGEALKRRVAPGEPPESLDASPAPPHPLAVLSWDWGCTHGALCHSKRGRAASCALPRAGCRCGRRATAGGIDVDGADLPNLAAHKERLQRLNA